MENTKDNTPDDVKDIIPDNVKDNTHVDNAENTQDIVLSDNKDDAPRDNITRDKINGVIFGHVLADMINNQYSVLSEHLLVVVQSYINNSNITYDINMIDIAQRMQSCDNVHINPTLEYIINDPEFIINPQSVANKVWINSGKKMCINVCLPRCSVLGLLPGDIKQAVVDLTHITHAAPECILCCVLYAMIINKLVYPSDTISPTYIDTIVVACSDIIRESNMCQLLSCVDAYKKGVKDLDLSGNNCYSIIKCFSCVMYTLQIIKFSLEHNKTPSFTKIIKHITGQGGSSDVNAVTVGALLGAYLGSKKLPPIDDAQLLNISELFAQYLRI